MSQRQHRSLSTSCGRCRWRWQRRWPRGCTQRRPPGSSGTGFSRIERWSTAAERGRRDPRPAAEEVGRVMAEIDKDGDGFIELREFTEFHKNGTSSSPDATNKELRYAFDLYDKNGNGLISELHAVMKSLGEKCSLADCSRMIASVDVDSDGCVNFEEFKKMMKV
ncbi:hypothetical protein RHSIM_Rhsim08G0219500 [Rhododendron simsii]|uniref:EF-hand domain-containing protein n=2 Tax=Rhododendron simsii TaxID=118357 RepID=A0A834LG18_RHOSS|nr:hypothetical protein RHSIM_Rhsim08G0219500 [Rhododendron simsii]